MSDASTSGGRTPDFLLIGAMKSATTFLATWLRSHPGVYVVPGKELHYFDREDVHVQGDEWYLAQFAAAPAGAVAGEATPTYLSSAEAPARMRALVPDVRLVAILRNPVDRTYSHYWHTRARHGDPLSFWDALDAEPERVRAGGPDPSRYAYAGASRYADHLERLAGCFARDQLLVLLYEELVAAPEALGPGVCGHLGVAADGLGPPPAQPVNAYQSYRSQWVRQAVRRLPSSLARVAGRANQRRVPYQPLAPADRKRLAARFADDNRRLSAWLGRDLPGWDV